MSDSKDEDPTEFVPIRPIAKRWMPSSPNPERLTVRFLILWVLGAAVCMGVAGGNLQHNAGLAAFSIIRAAIVGTYFAVLASVVWGWLANAPTRLSPGIWLCMFLGVYNFVQLATRYWTFGVFQENSLAPDAAMALAICIPICGRPTGRKWRIVFVVLLSVVLLPVLLSSMPLQANLEDLIATVFEFKYWIWMTIGLSGVASSVRDARLHGQMYWLSVAAWAVFPLVA